MLGNVNGLMLLVLPRMFDSPDPYHSTRSGVFPYALYSGQTNIHSLLAVPRPHMFIAGHTAMEIVLPLTRKNEPDPQTLQN